MTRQLFDHQGRPVALGKELGKGGEGAVYEIRGVRDHVAKVYLEPADSEKARKLALMIRLGADSLKQFAAWPVATLHQRSAGPTLGLVMPRINKPTEIHELYSPAHRKVAFPKADWHFLTRTALNCAAAFDSLHGKGIVIGDVNQGNILVSDRATVNLIDCDSFQISGNGATYKCKVGVAHFTPPEVSNYEILRTANHDNFGLAVMIFHLLFMGRHPFSGRFSGHGDMPLEKAIKESRFAYGRYASNFHMAPPPSSLVLQEVGNDIANMFEAAFADPKLNRPRPSAAQWGHALLKLESGLRKCSRDPGHLHYQGVQCPFCRIMQQGGPNFFISVSVVTAADRIAKFNLHRAWFEIQSVKGPQESLPLTAPIQTAGMRPRPLSNFEDVTKLPRQIMAGIASGGLLMTALGVVIPMLAVFAIPITAIFSIWWGLLYITRPIKKEIRKRKLDLARSRAELDAARQNLSYVMQRHIQAFDAKRQKLGEAKSRYQNLDSMRDSDYRDLQANAKERQLDDYLDRCFISSAKIRGIGQSRIVTLESYGIETAADITYDRVRAVPGFGPVFTEELVIWRQTQESRFRFDPSKGAPKTAIQALDMKYLQLKSQIQQVLETGPSELRRLSNAAQAETGRLSEQLAQLELALHQAKLDASVTDYK